MKILVISQYYDPEPGATSHRMKSFVDAMVKRGHEVTVICEFPNHPAGILDRKDRWRLFRSEKHESYRIIRTFVLTFRRKNNIKRMLFYLSFSLSSFITAILLKKQDVIFSSSPPIFHVFGAMIAAKIRGSKFTLDIRDIWPEVALGIKAVSNGRLLKWGGYLERKLYQSADFISATTKGQKELIEERGGDGRTMVSYNGSDEMMLNWRGEITELRKTLGWENKVVVCYAGLIGLAQDLDSLTPEFAPLNSDGILFAFIGSGPGEEALRDVAAKYDLKNIRFLQMMPRADVIPYIYASDIMMVVLRESHFFKCTIPSKVFDYMAAGKPVLTNVDGELREIVTSNNAGLYFSLKDKGSFGRAIKRLINDPELRSEMGANGKRLVEEKFIRSRLAEEMVRRLEN
jgi:colanic acid biosynthesis glycosyl transferase WcaI